MNGSVTGCAVRPTVAAAIRAALLECDPRAKVMAARKAA